MSSHWVSRCVGVVSLSMGLLVSAPVVAESPAPVTPASVLEAAGDGAWQDMAAEDLIVMTLADGSKVVWQLAPAFAPEHVANIRAFARAGWWDGAAIIRVHDNYVVQWGWPSKNDDAPEPTYPAGVNPAPPAEYDGNALKTFEAMEFKDAYAAYTGHIDGWPVASDGPNQWLVHCYGMIGVARGVNPDTGSGSQLYTVMGHAPRHLDRNLAVVGRVVSGMEHLTGLKRGTGALGFYETDAERTKIVSIKLASELPEAERPRLQYLSTGSIVFKDWLKARANRQDDFFLRPAGALDICNALPPIRTQP